MIVSVRATRRERVDPRHEERGAQAERDEAGGEPQPRIDALGREEPFRGEHQDAEAEHRGRVHHRHRRADRDRLAERAAAADQVRADQRLAVPRTEGVHGPDPDRRDDHQRDETRRQIGSSGESGEEPTARRPRRIGRGVRAESGAARPEGEGGGSDARGRDVRGIGPEAHAGALARDVGANDRGAVADSGDFAPAESVRIVAIFEREVMRGGRRDPRHEDAAEAECRQPGLPGGQREARRAQGERSGGPVDPERQPRPQVVAGGPAVRGGLAR